jgi:ATP phosphoribosyltransferase
MGITGQDIIAESNSEVRSLMSLGIGKCRLCLQAPIGQYASPKDLAGKRIVTSFPNLARKYFDKLEAEGYPHTTIKYGFHSPPLLVLTPLRYVSGSVEAACGLGLADAIIDLVETGTTMKAAGLEIVDVVMTTETMLLSNPHTPFQSLVEKIHRRIAGYVTATQNCLITYNVERSKQAEAMQITPGHESPTIMPLEDPGWISVSALIGTKNVSEVMDRLIEIGAKSILVTALANCRF